MIDRTLRAVALALLLPALAACQSGPLESRTEILVLEVAAETVPCVGEMRDRCLQIRSRGEDAWERFHGTIEGFEHEEGVRYLLEVERRRIPDPPADGSSYAYRLLEILDRERVGSGP